MSQSIELASVFSDQMNGIEAASTTAKLIDAGVIFIVAGTLNIGADRTNLPALKWLCWGASALGAYVIYLALFA